MTNKQLFATFEPLFTVGLERIQKFNKPELRDMVKIFAPVFNSICKAADVPADGVSSLLESLDPNAVTLDGLCSVVNKLTFKPAEQIRALNKQEALRADIEGIDDRSAPLAQRSRTSLQKEIAEGWKRNSEASTKRAMLQEDELERRDAEAEGRAYEPRYRHPAGMPLYPVL
jgi:hypothetical protein